MPTRDALVLAHGAFHGPWCFKPLEERLEAAGVRCVAVDLNRGGLAADRDALHEAIDALRDTGHRVHALGHSLGCASVAAIDPERLASAVLLAGSVAAIDGMPIADDLLAPGLLGQLRSQPDGRAFVDRETARAVFYHRCSPEQQAWALDRLRPTFVYGCEASDPVFWQAIPVTYVACADDRAVQPHYQRAIAKRMRFSTILEGDHSPFLSAPDRLALVVLEAMARADEVAVA